MGEKRARQHGAGCFAWLIRPKRGAASAAARARYGLTGQEPQVIGAGVLLRAALGVMDKHPPRFACAL